MRQSQLASFVPFLRKLIRQFQVVYQNHQIQSVTVAEADSRLHLNLTQQAGKEDQLMQLSGGAANLESHPPRTTGTAHRDESHFLLTGTNHTSCSQGRMQGEELLLLSTVGTLAKLSLTTGRAALQWHCRSASKTPLALHDVPPRACTPYMPHWDTHLTM